MEVIGAAMRKLLHLVFGILKTGRPFDPNYLNLMQTLS
jgi:transposase